MPINQTKIFIKNVPTTPTTKEDVKTLLLKHVQQVVTSIADLKLSDN